MDGGTWWDLMWDLVGLELNERQIVDNFSSTFVATAHRWPSPHLHVARARSSPSRKKDICPFLAILAASNIFCFCFCFCFLFFFV